MLVGLLFGGRRRTVPAVKHDSLRGLLDFQALVADDAVQVGLAPALGDADGAGLLHGAADVDARADHAAGLVAQDDAVVGVDEEVLDDAVLGQVGGGKADEVRGRRQVAQLLRRAGRVGLAGDPAWLGALATWLGVVVPQNLGRVRQAGLGVRHRVKDRIMLATHALPRWVGGSGGRPGRPASPRTGGSAGTVPAATRPGPGRRSGRPDGGWARPGSGPRRRRTRRTPSGAAARSTPGRDTGRDP